MSSLGKRRFLENTKLIIWGGFKDGRRCLGITRDSQGNDVDLTSNHEEADTRMLFHAKYVASPIIWNRRSSFECSPLCEHYTGVKDQMRFVPIDDVCQKLGDSVLAALPVFHAITGCDNNSSISVWVMNSPFLRWYRSFPHRGLHLYGRGNMLQSTRNTMGGRRCQWFWLWWLNYETLSFCLDRFTVFQSGSFQKL